MKKVIDLGLDMYLYGVHENFEKYLSKYDDNNTKKKTIISYSVVKTEEMYWRKCYIVDEWIVNNVQDGINDCDYHEITIDDLKELKSFVELELKENGNKIDDYDEWWLNYTITEIDRLVNEFEELGYERLEYRNSW